MGHNVFVYGTLLRGESNHGLLRHARPLERQAWISGRLYDTGDGYPAAVISGPGEPAAECRVYGELYGVDDETLADLDALEDYFEPGNPGNLYERERVAVSTDTGSREAWTYCFRSEQAEGLRSIPLGDWRVDRRLGRWGSARGGGGRELGEMLYFAYGSCMDDRRFWAQGAGTWFRDAAGRGTLEGYRLRFTCDLPDGGRADLVEEGGIAEGKLYRIGKEAVEYLWRREGVDAGVYRPAIVWVRTENDATAEALTFFVRNKAEEKAPPPIYMEEILRGAEPVVSASYYEALERISARWFRQ